MNQSVSCKKSILLFAGLVVLPSYAHSEFEDILYQCNTGSGICLHVTPKLVVPDGWRHDIGNSRWNCIVPITYFDGSLFRFTSNARIVKSYSTKPDRDFINESISKLKSASNEILVVSKQINTFTKNLKHKYDSLARDKDLGIRAQSTGILTQKVQLDAEQAQLTAQISQLIAQQALVNSFRVLLSGLQDRNMISDSKDAILSFSDRWRIRICSNAVPVKSIAKDDKMLNLADWGIANDSKYKTLVVDEIKNLFNMDSADSQWDPFVLSDGQKLTSFLVYKHDEKPPNEHWYLFSYGEANYKNNHYSLRFMVEAHSAIGFNVAKNAYRIVLNSFKL